MSGIHCENGMCGICDECRAEDEATRPRYPSVEEMADAGLVACGTCLTPRLPSEDCGVCGSPGRSPQPGEVVVVQGQAHPLTAEQRVAVLERALADSERERKEQEKLASDAMVELGEVKALVIQSGRDFAEKISKVAAERDCWAALAGADWQPLSVREAIARGDIEALKAEHARREEFSRKMLDTIAWQAKQLDEALARAERAEEQWRASQREAEALGRMLAAGQGVP